MHNKFVVVYIHHPDQNLEYRYFDNKEDTERFLKVGIPNQKALTLVVRQHAPLVSVEFPKD